MTETKTENPTAAYLRVTMAKYKLNQKQMADFLGVAPNTLNNWINRGNNPEGVIGRMIDILMTIEVMAPEIYKALLPRKGSE